jgi:aspartate/methionine/tyrosine aminotransferase
MKHNLNKDILDLESSGIRKINAEASRVEGVISLTIGEPMFNTASEVIETAIDSLHNNQTKYPPYEGLVELRETIVAFEKKSQNIDYLPEEVLITQGASGALFAALGTVLNPEDEVIVFDPAYVAYFPTIKIFKGVPVVIDTTPEKFQLSYEKIKNAITPKTKAIIINSPNNPTGCIYNKKSLEAITKIMDEHDIYVISDDVYNQLVYTDNPEYLIQNQKYKSQIIYCQSMSKPYSMTGWRIGYILAEKAIIDQAKKIQQYVAAGIPPFIQQATSKAFNADMKPIIEKYKKNLDVALSILDKHHISYIQPQGAFYLFIDISKSNMSSWDFARLLLKKEKVAVVPGLVFSQNTDCFVRISFSTEFLKVVDGVTRFSTFLNNQTENNK